MNFDTATSELNAWFGDHTIPQINPEEVAGEFTGYSPQDFQDVLDTANEYGETVVARMDRGVYAPTETITIPRQDHKGAIIDMSSAVFRYRGETPPDPIIELPESDGSSSGRVSMIFRGPRLIDADGEPPGNLSRVAVLYGLVNSDVLMPKTLGPWQSIIQKESKSGSGHINRISAFGNGMDRMYVIGKDSNNTQDRTWFRGQAANIRVTAVEAFDARDNFFYVQTETKSSSAPGEVRGYHFRGDAGRNYIGLAHNKPDTPIDNRGQVSLGPHIWLAPDIMGKSRLGEWHLTGGTPKMMTAPVPMAGPGQAGFETSPGVNHRNFGETQINAGTSGGNTEYVMTPGRVGSIDNNPLLCSAVVDMEDIDSATFRMGFISGGGTVDPTTFAGIVYEPGTDPDNWIYRFTDGGTVQTETISSQSVTGNDRITAGFTDPSGDGNECYAHAGPEGAGNRNRPLIGNSEDSVSSFSHPRFRMDVTVNGSPGSAQEAGILRELKVFGGVA